MTQFTRASIFDADQHRYETPDSLTKYLPEKYLRAVQFAQIGRLTGSSSTTASTTSSPTRPSSASPRKAHKFFAGENAEGLNERRTYDFMGDNARRFMGLPIANPDPGAKKPRALVTA